MIKIAITGPESSGKTTLAKNLSEELGGSWIPEFARGYLLEKEGNYDQSDLLEIAKGQLVAWDMAEFVDYLFCDTDMLVMKIWSDFKYQETHPFILEALDNQRFDHYFLCRPDIPWEDDPLREHPEQREQLFELYLKELQARNWPFTIVQGDQNTRLQIAKEVLAKLS
jgi:NadR type nicotinamide-nucleotide adenylyltransferase